MWKEFHLVVPLQRIIPLKKTQHKIIQRDKLGGDEDKVGEEAGDKEDEG